MQLAVIIHGLAVEDLDCAARYLCGWLRTATYAGINGKNKDLFKARNEYDSDIEVVLIESAQEDVELMQEIRGYLAAAADGSMSRNNSEALARELLRRIDS